MPQEQSEVEILPMPKNNTSVFSVVQGPQIENDVIVLEADDFKAVDKSVTGRPDQVLVQSPLEGRFTLKRTSNNNPTDNKPVTFHSKHITLRDSNQDSQIQTKNSAIFLA